MSWSRDKERISREMELGFKKDVDNLLFKSGCRISFEDSSVYLEGDERVLLLEVENPKKMWHDTYIALRDYLELTYPFETNMTK